MTHFSGKLQKSPAILSIDLAEPLVIPITLVYRSWISEINMYTNKLGMTQAFVPYDFAQVTYKSHR